VPKWLATVAGASALGAVSLSICALVVGVHNRQLDRRWLGVVLVVMLAGFIGAGVGRIVTAGVVGANIGAGFALFFGLPIWALLVGFAALMSRDLVRSRATP
jgi:hypothetical protein